MSNYVIYRSLMNIFDSNVLNSIIWKEDFVLDNDRYKWHDEYYIKDDDRFLLNYSEACWHIYKVNGILVGILMEYVENESVFYFEDDYLEYNDLEEKEYNIEIQEPFIYLMRDVSGGVYEPIIRDND